MRNQYTLLLNNYRVVLWLLGHFSWYSCGLGVRNSCRGHIGGSRASMRLEPRV
ncbi:hypothetical protein AG1IA_01325 [Rhizoctonia solani AG-1 IA]|uniref:Uncharacterized protein n=1 Tax=Thanatephorus cucumeris (strain AG1-IA) TaxID=983506 RepID=L8X6G2_THACA|nr:hypothetical protein AG1IA_01325 [Rhizoctonia solani AG-1 IA]